MALAAGSSRFGSALIRAWSSASSASTSLVQSKRPSACICGHSRSKRRSWATASKLSVLVTMSSSTRALATSPASTNRRARRTAQLLRSTSRAARSVQGTVCR